MSVRDKELLTLWKEGETLEAIAVRFGKTPTSIGHKLVRLGIFGDRFAVSRGNQDRGGGPAANLERDALYTIYVVRNPNTHAPIYVGQPQNFRKRRKNHVRRFSKFLGGETPIIQELEAVPSYAHAREVERKRIAEFLARGFSLLNVQDR